MLDTCCQMITVLLQLFLLLKGFPGESLGDGLMYCVHGKLVG